MTECSNIFEAVRTGNFEYVAAASKSELESIEPRTVPDLRMSELLESDYYGARAASGGMSPLMIASMLGDEAMVGKLLAAGASVNKADEVKMFPMGWTALNYAIKYGHSIVAESLIKAGANVNVEDIGLKGEIGGRNPLHYAVEQSSLSCVRLLCDHKADVNGSDNSGDTPVTLAVRLREQAVLMVLLDCGGDLSDGLRAACDSVNSELVSLFLSRGAKPTPRSTTLLLQPCFKGHLEIVRILLEQGVSPKPSYSDKTGNRTPIFLATYGDHVDIVRLLLERGAVFESSLIRHAKKYRAHRVLKMLQTIDREKS